LIGIYVRSTVMWSSYNSYSRCILLDWFNCFHHRTEQGNRR